MAAACEWMPVIYVISPGGVEQGSMLLHRSDCCCSRAVSLQSACTSFLGIPPGRIKSCRVRSYGSCKANRGSQKSDVSLVRERAATHFALASLDLPLFIATLTLFIILQPSDFCADCTTGKSSSHTVCGQDLDTRVAHGGFSSSAVKLLLLWARSCLQSSAIVFCILFPSGPPSLDLISPKAS